MCGLVPCTSPHELEVTGRVTYADADEAEATTATGVDQPPDPRCLAVTERYLGGPVPPPWLVLREPIAPVSWAAGRRMTHCFVAQVDRGHRRVLTVSESPRG
ncbi:MAG TPA: septum formation family protein [Acidimicrobiales bacterium]|nr:septum formation family protein [Acidimicrobiales bacterium]